MNVERFNKFMKISLIAIALVIGVVVIRNNIENSKTATTEKVEVGYEHDAAYYMAQKIIKGGLKSPSSARFQNRYDGVEIDYSPEKDEYYLKFWGDADNAFGVSMRTKYYVAIKHVGELWKITDLMKN